MDQKIDFKKYSLAVFLAGMSGMGAELVAGRQIAPWFGSSVTAWGMLIGVILTGLTLGYYSGGRLASKYRVDKLVSSTLILASASLAITAVAYKPILLIVASNISGVALGVTVSVGILYGPFSFLIGMVSPLVAELNKEKNRGQAAGDVYAIGTLGSIAGIFFTTLVLIPLVEIQFILMLFSGLTIISAAFINIDRYRISAILLVLLFSIFTVSAAPEKTDQTFNGNEVIYQTLSPYQEVKVVETSEQRLLLTDDRTMNRASAESPHRPEIIYENLFDTAFLFNKDIEKVLFIGGGGFNGPRLFRERYNATVDAVELDPAVVYAAKKYMGVKESPEFQIHTADGRKYLRETDEEYDLIVMDAYRKMKIPFHLTTKEFMDLSDERLSEDGILLYYRFGRPDSKFQQSMTKTMNQEFKETVILGNYDLNESQNYAQIGMNKVAPGKEELRHRMKAGWAEVNLSDKIRNYYRKPPEKDGMVLRDGYAPVNTMQEGIYFE